MTLEQWVNATPTQADVMIAAVTTSRFSDTYYGQWLVLHCPFRELHELRDDQVQLVPEGYRYFAMCLLRRPDFWRDLGAVQRDLELEAFSDSLVSSNIAMLRAHTALIDDYLAGRLVLNEADPEHAPEAAAAADVEARLLDRLQWRIVHDIGQRVLALRIAADNISIPALFA